MPINESCTGSYLSGCRCRKCKDWMNTYQRNLYHRRRNNIEAGTDLLPAAAAAGALRALRDAGLTWEQISAATNGCDIRSLQRIHNGSRKYATRWVTEQCTAAAVDIPAHRGGSDDGLTAVWMVRALTAKGWPTSWIGERLGWAGPCKPSDLHKGTTPELLGRVRALFDENHWQQGPSTVTMLRALRSGHLPADCHDWERGDTRPIPGTLHPDLVAAAATYAHPTPGDQRPAATLALLRSLGQWESARCANAVHRTWAIRHGLPHEGPYCADPAHPHQQLPSMWHKRAAPAAA